jgi:predicted transposase/invertase (TIGR01784 family)
VARRWSRFPLEVFFLGHAMSVPSVFQIRQPCNSSRVLRQILSGDRFCDDLHVNRTGTDALYLDHSFELLSMTLYLKDKYVNLLTDFGFKRVFGTELNKNLLIDFLNTLLPENRQIRDLTFKNNENIGNIAIDRKAIFDIYCQGENGERFIVEIQKAKQNFFKDRSVFYSTFPIQEQALKGEWNFQLAPVYAVGILDFVFADHRDSETMIHTVELKDQSCNVFYDKLKFIYIELPKFKKTVDQLESHTDKWLFLLKNLAELDDRPGSMQEEIFSELFDVAEIANFSSNEQDIYQNTLKYYRDWNNITDTMREEALKEGHEEGIKEGVEIGLVQGQRSLILRLLSLKLGEIPAATEGALNQISSDRLADLSDRLLEFATLDDLHRWLETER